MSDLEQLTRIVDDGTEDAFLRDVFASAHDDAPDAARRAATLAALSPDLVTEPVKANAPVTVPPTKAASSTSTSTAATTTTATSTATLKWVVIIGLAAGALAVGLYATSGPDKTPPVTTPSASSTAAGSGPVIEQPIAQPKLAPAEAPSALAVSPSSAASASASAASGQVTRDPAPRSSAAPKERAPLGLAEETAILDRARGALDRGDARGALAELDKYDGAPGPKILGQEATMVRIEALSAKGDRAAARALAQSFLARNPGSTYDDRVRALIAEPKKP